MRLGCTLSKDNCQVTWLKDEQEINVEESEDNRFVATHDGRSYRLEVKESKMIDAGSYTIKVEDKQQSCLVMITGKTFFTSIAELESSCSPLQKPRSRSSFH